MRVELHNLKDSVCAMNPQNTNNEQKYQLWRTRRIVPAKSETRMQFNAVSVRVYG